MAFDAQTATFYASNARAYLAKRPDLVTPQLPAFLDTLPPGARILELGCGGGQDAEYMLERGFDVDATDGIPAMAAIAQERIGRSVRLMRFDELAVIEEYHAVIACAALLHVPAGDLPDIAARIWRALKPGGWHLSTFKTAGAALRDEHGRYYNYPTQNEAETIYRAAGEWRSIAFSEFDDAGYFSAPARWLMVTTCKTGECR